MSKTLTLHRSRRAQRGRTLNGILARLSPNGESMWLHIPQWAARPCGGCECTYCQRHPDRVPRWDTLAVPFDNGWAYTVHAPEFWRPDR
jgi:hypothetical protein